MQIPGSVSLISKSWGRRVSNAVHLTENCDLLPGIAVLADHGFTIDKDPEMHCAEVKIPPFRRQKKQLSKLEVASFLKLEFMFSILQLTLSINMLKGDKEVLSS